MLAAHPRPETQSVVPPKSQNETKTKKNSGKKKVHNAEAPAILFLRSDLIFVLAGKSENKIGSKK